LAPSFPATELRYIINNSGAIALLSTPRYATQSQEVLENGIESIDCHYHQLEDLTNRSDGDSVQVDLTDLSTFDDSGMMLFTSGTTARPKGVMLSNFNLVAQAQSLLTAWQYSPSDHFLHILPLHHIHGTVNALLTPLLAGSSIEFMYPFDANAVWKRIASPFLPSNEHDNAVDNTTHESPQVQKHGNATPISVLTAVPTVWARMLQAYPIMSPDLQQAGQEAVSRRNLRLNMSGSAQLPKSIREGWSKLSCGNVLLERYGMTEVGMALSCGLDDTDRIESSVGWPLPSVQARLMEKDDKGKEKLIPLGEEIDPISKKERQGEIQLRGPTVFKEYWQNRTATEKEFTQDGWFRTGDIATRRLVPNSGSGKSGSWASGPAYFIQGRQSTDIIKTGGEKVSALEIEREILTFPQINECAVVGLPSEGWGQKVAALVVLAEECGDKPYTLADLRRELKTRLVPYKIPQDLEIVSAIKRNAMGKVNKKELVPSVFGSPDTIRRRSIDLQDARNAARKRSKE
jgi:acyl-CoA synthetase (AMP-forming)/AMP-acid ligase II